MIIYYNVSDTKKIMGAEIREESVTNGNSSHTSLVRYSGNMYYSSKLFDGLV